MSIKIAGTVVINNDRELKEITGNVGRIKTNNSGYGISSTTDNINISTPMMNCILGGDTTFTETSVLVGNSAQMLLDLSTNNHTPTFSSNVSWADGTTPTWSGYQRWHICFTVIAADEIRAVAFGYTAASGGTPLGWPGATTITAREGGTNLTGVSDKHVSLSYGVQDPVTSTSSCTVAFYRRSVNGSEIFFTPTGTGGATNGYYTQSSGAFVSRTSGQTTEIWEENSVSPDSTRCVIKSTSGTIISDTGYVASASVGTGASASVSTTASTTSSMGTNTSNSTTTRLLECWARKSGYEDTKVATWRFEASAQASGSGCFLGSANLYRWNVDTNTVNIMTLDSAYSQWSSKEDGEVHYVIGKDGLHKEITGFRTFPLQDTFYAINGSDAFVSSTHPFLTTDGWKCPGEDTDSPDYPDLDLTQLAVGDILKKYNSETNEYYDEEVTSIIRGPEKVRDVYSLSVGGDDTYIVDGHIVHNK